MKLIDVNALKTAFPCGEYVRTESVRATIDSMPTIDAVPVRHGKWTRDYESSWGDSRFMCSVCHCKESVPTCNGEPTIWDYCPNCGAKMDLEVVKDNETD